MAVRTEANVRSQITGKLSGAQLFPTPLYAMLQNSDGTTESVRVLGMGDVEGHSPCYHFVGNDGVPQWDSTGKFTIIDPTCLPASKEALANLARTLTSGTQSQDTAHR